MSVFVKVGVCVFSVLFLAGCATTSSVKQTQQMQERVASLEADLDKANEQIKGLESQLEAAQKGDEQRKAEEQYATAAPLSHTQIQTALVNAGYYSGAIDGKLGPQTRDALKDFQTANNLKADGVVGKKTRVRLYRYLK